MSDDINIVFCRSLLSAVQADLSSQQRGDYRKNAWTYRTDKRTFEFHWGEFYWYGRADNAYDARFKGLNAWMRKHGTPEQQEKYK